MTPDGNLRTLRTFTSSSGALAAGLNLGEGAGPMAHNFDYHGEFAE